jgi:prevent-host-death family protein
MRTYSITEAKAKFSEVIESVLQGEEVIVTKMGKPAVKISAYEAIDSNKRLGLMQGQAIIPDDFKEWTEPEAKIFGIVK